MPKYNLELKLNLENLDELEAVGTDFRWYIKVRCSNCGEVPDHWVYVTQEEKQEMGRGSANLFHKCKLCKRENSIDIIVGSHCKYFAAKNLQFQNVISFDCRGMEPIEFDPRIGWQAKGLDSDMLFKEVNLSEKEWCDYDEKSNVTVGIYEFESRFVKAK